MRAAAKGLAGTGSRGTPMRILHEKCFEQNGEKDVQLNR